MAFTEFPKFSINFNEIKVEPKEAAKTTLGKLGQRALAVVEIVSAVAFYALSGIALLAGGFGMSAIVAVPTPFGHYALACVAAGALTFAAGFGGLVGSTYLFKDGIERFEAQNRNTSETLQPQLV